VDASRNAGPRIRRGLKSAESFSELITSSRDTFIGRAACRMYFKGMRELNKLTLISVKN
jgi:hypothetical protein